jgi:LacI family transcriptional regulator
MRKASTSIAPHAPARRRRILLALDSKNDDFKAGVYGLAARAGWSVLDLRHCGMKIPEGYRPDGVIFRLGPEYVPLVRRFLRLGLPAVQADEFIKASGCARVFQDIQSSGRAAAEHFVERGFRSVAYLHSEEYDYSTLKPHGESFVGRARELGAASARIAVQSAGRIIGWEHTRLLARRFAKAISGLPLPLGVFTYHDIMASRICQYCEILGLRVPEQVAVLGYGNDLQQCNFAPIPLSSVDPNHFGHGRAAAEMLERLMDGEAPPAEPIPVPPAGVVTRQSTDVLALPDVDTARALRYMWQHLSEPLGVNDIADAVAISRRKLERRFQTYLQRGVGEELVRKRLERACELLVATRTRVKVISEQVGFTTEKHFFRAFRKAMGTSPRQYRLAQTARLGAAENAGPTPPFSPPGLPAGQARRK